MNRETLKSLFVKADIHANPAIYEPTGIAILEAMESKKPVIASAMGGIPEKVGEAGISMAPDQPVEPSRSIELFLENPEMRSRYSKLAPDSAITYEWWNIATRSEPDVEERIR